MGYAALLHRVLQGLGNRILPDQVAKRLRPVLEVKGLVRHRLPRQFYGLAGLKTEPSAAGANKKEAAEAASFDQTLVLVVAAFLSGSVRVGLRLVDTGLLVLVVAGGGVF